MKVEVSEADRTLAADIHRLFSAKPDSEHIASKFALAHLAAILRTHKIGSVLEIGAGIGTMTYLLLSMLPDSVAVVCTEANELCLAALDENLPREVRNRLMVHRDAHLVERAFDLVVIDGSVDGVTAALFRPGSVCFAEGKRAKERRKIQQLLNERQMACAFTNYLPWSFQFVRQRIEWRPLRVRLKAWLGIEKPLPAITRRKGCWVGRVERLRVRGV
jgi:protein-L-isoaspartate O-methyltransferase